MMFTGIIEEIGTVAKIVPGERSLQLTLNCHTVLEDAGLGDSIAVNGVCLTVTSRTDHSFTADVMAETVRRSALGSLKTGSRVNLERAMAAGGRFGGHIVSGHIDGTGKIRDFKKEDNAIWVTIEAPEAIMRYIVEKGSIAIDGISLTVARVNQKEFAVSVIPHTKEQTVLLSKRPGEAVNLENDIIGKYVEKLMGFGEKAGDGNQGQHGGVSMELLAANGFL